MVPGRPHREARRGRHVWRTRRERRDARAGRCLACGGPGHEFEDQTIGILAAQRLLVEPCGHLPWQRTSGCEAVGPELKRPGGDREAGHLGRARPGPTAGRVFPREERHGGARRPGTVAVVEVVGSGIVEIHGLLDRTEPEEVRVEIHVPLRRPRNRGDVVNARNAQCFRFGIGSEGRQGTFGPSHGRLTCLWAYQPTHSTVRLRCETRPGARVGSAQ